MAGLLKQPLIHFLAAGLLVFALYQWAAGDRDRGGDDDSITVTRDSLLEFLQYRSSAFNEDYFTAQLAQMSNEERRFLINELIREEVLYREALKLGLERNDYVIKRRLVQKMEFLTRGFAAALDGFDDGSLHEYYTANREDYRVRPHVTFTHVFFDFEKHGRGQAAELAAATLIELNRHDVAYNDAIMYGDRFLYFTNYVERTPDYVASHFGIPMAETIFALSADPGRWQGPYESIHGLHLVMLVDNQPGRYPDLSEVRDRVRTDAGLARTREQTEAAIQALISDYDVRLLLDQDDTGTDG